MQKVNIDGFIEKLFTQISVHLKILFSIGILNTFKKYFSIKLQNN